MDMFITLIVLMQRWNAYVQTHHSLCIKHVQFFLHISYTSIKLKIYNEEKQ